MNTSSRFTMIFPFFLFENRRFRWLHYGRGSKSTFNMKTTISIRQFQLPAWDPTASNTGSRQKIHTAISPSIRKSFRIPAVVANRSQKNNLRLLNNPKSVVRAKSQIDSTTDSSPLGGLARDNFSDVSIYYFKISCALNVLFDCTARE